MDKVLVVVVVGGREERARRAVAARVAAACVARRRRDRVDVGAGARTRRDALRVAHRRRRTAARCTSPTASVYRLAHDFATLPENSALSER